MKKILITGANGMIGSAIVREFINKYELILVDPHTSRIEQYKGRVTILKRSLTEISEWQDVLDEVYCVIHLAAAVHWVPKTRKEEQKFIDTNAEGTRKLYNVCSKHGVKRFLYFSTNDVYEASDKVITENTDVKPNSIYGESKLIAEKYLLEDIKKGKTAVCIFRPASIFGENDRGSMKSMISFCRKGFVPMIGKGENKKALLYLKDIVHAVELYVDNKSDLNGEILNISSGDFGYKEIIDTICNSYGFKPFRIYIPIWFCRSIATKVGPIKKLSIAAKTMMTSNEKASKMIKYKAKYTLSDGLMDAKNYYFQVED